MARLLTQVLGIMSGSVGDIVFRRRGGRSYVSAHPSSYTPRTDAASMARKKQFKTAMEIGKTINSIPLVKAIWPADPTKATSKFNKMVSVNYKLINGDDLTGQPTLTPDFGFGMTNAAVEIAANAVTFSADALGVNLGIDTSTEKTYSTVGLILLNGPIDPLSPDIQVIKFSSAAVNLDLLNPIEVSHPLSVIDQQIIAKYTNKRAFVAFLTLDDFGKVIKHSTTYGS